MRLRLIITICENRKVYLFQNLNENFERKFSKVQINIVYVN